jgi:flavin reductase (DIM6/NTAB) family NADH-FMN oxidoreductase RutF
MVDLKLVWEAIHKVRNGVSIVTSYRGDEVNGLTAAWVSQVSQKPPMVMVSVAPPRYTHDMIKETGQYAVNILGEDQIELAKLFGFKSGKQINKFKNVEYERKTTGAPIIKNALAYLDCEVDSATTAGDHTIFVGKVVDCEIRSKDEPLIYLISDFWG